ncbi:hypothetical protein JG688_00002538, partial [Phytophthora aleatoria]
IWYATCGAAGIVSSQNALASHNGVIKICGVTSKAADCQNRGLSLGEQAAWILLRRTAKKGPKRRRYPKRKCGDLGSVDNTLESINDECLSLHEVKLLDSSRGVTPFKLRIEPKASRDKITQTRTRCRCDCTWVWITGWLCFHVLGVISMRNQLDVTEAWAALSVRKLSGDQRKVPGALERDNTSSLKVTKAGH